MSTYLEPVNRAGSDSTEESTMTTTQAHPDLTRIAGRVLTRALDHLPEIVEEGVTWSLSDECGSTAVLWRRGSDDEEFVIVGNVEITLAVTPR